MAYIANTTFEVKVSNAVFDETANITGTYQSSGTGEICSAGFLCTRTSLLPNNGYTGIYNTNAYIMGAAASTAVDGIYAFNPYQVNQITDPTTGMTYKVGQNTYGLPLPAGANGTFTKIDFTSGDCIYRFGSGNMSTTVGSNTYFTVAAGLLVPDDSAPSTVGAIYFTLVATGTATVGAYAGATYYDVMAHRVFAA